MNISGRVHRSGKQYHQKNDPKKKNPENPQRNENLTQRPNQNEQRKSNPNPKVNQKPSTPETNPKILKSNQSTPPDHHQTSQSANQNQINPNTITVSEVKRLWTDLSDPIAYSGNSKHILNRIKSFQ